MPRWSRRYYADMRAAEVVMARARVLREDAGTVSGHAAGVTPVRRSSLLEDTLAVMTGDRQHCGPLAEQLAQSFPDQYAGLGQWPARRCSSRSRRVRRQDPGRSGYRCRRRHPSRPRASTQGPAGRLTADVGV